MFAIVIFLVIVVPVGFLALMIWDRRRLTSAPVQPLAREQMEKGFKPSNGLEWLAYPSLGALVLWGAYSMWKSPPHPPFTGRRAWIMEVLYRILGADGIVASAIVLGLLLIGLGLRRWHKDR